MSAAIRSATPQECARLWPEVRTEHLFPDAEAFKEYCKADPWRLRITERGEAAILGPWWGALTGGLSNVISSLSSPMDMWFAIVNIIVGLIVGYISVRFGFQKWLIVLVAGIIIAIVAPIVGTFIATYVYGGLTGGGIDIFTAGLMKSGADVFTAAAARPGIADMSTAPIEAHRGDRFMLQCNSSPSKV